ncbi:type I methionyl aminopeptidase [Teichococcus aestuarii]|uniref:Methionine aminopeptidase n=1 Tax=Teichococcus aestuarii TaxID=568898 RepID=A0A2U1UXI1_9PROT|nr:type I methionyl aminopeptidase [Pseudoroseomonas aestuarii]PWC26379.1 type I methionyl aminopeptidase [Pseudoroseomonas aestuarii]
MSNIAGGRRITLHAAEDFAGMRRAGRLAAETLDMITAHVRAGITTAELDRLCHLFILDHGAIPASLGYHGYTHATCISLNHVVCHGIPGDRALLEGDILNIDLAVILDGWHGDSSRMYTVGQVSTRAARLIEVAHAAMMRGIAAIRPGSTLGDIGFAMQSHAEAARFSVVRDFCGHGLGRRYHDAPDVLNYGQKGRGPELRPGMFLTVEPMINAGGPGVKVLGDGWTAVTRDRSLSAQFEHSIGVTEDGCEIFTLSPAGFTSPPYAQASQPAPGEEAPRMRPLSASPPRRQKR